MRRLLSWRENASLSCFSLIVLCFLLTSLGQLSWLYRLMKLISIPGRIERSVEVLGYCFQAAGLGLFTVSVRYRPKLVSRKGFVLVILAYLICLIPSVLNERVYITLLSGYLMNLFCGIIAGYYLHSLTCGVREKHRGTVFGLGYGCSCVVHWLLTLADGFLRSDDVLILCALLAGAAVYLFDNRLLAPREDNLPDEESVEPPGVTSGLIALAFFTIVLLSLVKNLGFAFPTSDLSSGTNLEFSRVFYAIGLIAAGIASDKNRKYGAILCLAALVIPFLMLILTGETVSATPLWSLNYFCFAFFSVFRVVLFSDLARRGTLFWLAGLGLLSGRIGDAAGTVLYLSVDGNASVLVIVAAGLFSFTVFIFFHLFQAVYAPVPVPKKTEQELFNAFSIRYQCSPRERDVLHLLLRGLSNSEIATELFVSESTVKFHIRNLLKKTGCKNRIELMTIFHLIEGKQS